MMDQILSVPTRESSKKTQHEKLQPTLAFFSKCNRSGSSGRKLLLTIIKYGIKIKIDEHNTV